MILEKISKNLKKSLASAGLLWYSYLVSVNLPADENILVLPKEEEPYVQGRAAEVAKVQATLERFGAKIEKVDDWGKRKLAYEIAKVNEGFYSFTTFEAPAAAPAEIEARMRIMENVLRYLIIRKDA